jgi:PadR family transcriptional regulator PadR
MSTSAKSEVLQGTLDLLILRTLEKGPLHGYAIGQQINQTSRALLQVPQGSLYPALHRLENKGWLAAAWVETEGGRRAKVYRLTRRGYRQLAREIAEWQRMAKAIGWVLQS